MSVFSNQFSINPERPVDPFTLSILGIIDQILRDAKVRYMLVGATARDLLLYHVFGHPVTRATYDLDFAILVDSWKQYAIVKQQFLGNPGFAETGRNAQRLYYQPAGGSFETTIDIIPFGKLETDERTIAWPPDAEVVMNVAAFSDVFENALSLEVRPDLVIPGASLPGLAVLKMFAWLDRHEDRDVKDLRRLMETYTDAGNVDRLYEEEADELARVGFDATVAGSYLLGKDARRITGEDVRTRLSAALYGTELTALVLELARTMSVLEDRTEPARTLLAGFLRGAGLIDLL